MDSCRKLTRLSVSTICLLVLLVAQAQCGSLDHLLTLKPKTSVAQQGTAVRGLISRLLPKQSHLIELLIDENFNINHHDKFKIEGVPGKHGIKITANTGVAAANGLYYYLKNVANCSTSWSGNQLHTLSLDSLPQPTKTIEVVIKDKFRYYQNVCTVSYSMVWWSWARWEQELDWMALRGINLPLAFNGQESVFRRVFMNHFNMTKSQVDNYFSGPAFLAWNRMGNMQTWSGPLSEHWHEQQEKLQKQILARMRDFGMYPVVPGFAGHVPRDLVTNLPKAKIDRLTNWGNFGKNYSYTYFLQPEDPNFAKVNELFIQEYINLFGTDHFYNIDLFNELTPTKSDPEYLHSTGKNVYDSIVKADPNGIWVMQGWLFVNQPGFWKQPQVKAMAQSVPIGKLLILDLFSEIKPIYPLFEGYYGQPFIWCMLHNFGGSKGLYGALNGINSELYPARKKYSNMLGIGLTPEGIEQNEAMYEYMMDTTWFESAPNMENWFSSYALRRYGLFDARLDKAWQLLRSSVYNDTIKVHNHGQYAINKRPKLTYHSPLWYQPSNLTDALRLMAEYLEANPAIVNKSETFVYDMVDVSRQALQLIFDYYREQKMYPQYVKHEVAHLKTTSTEMLHLFDLFESVLQCSEPFLLSRWVKTARALGNDTVEKDYNEWQARNQVTLWGPKGNILDYANKHWSGLVSAYYKPRWALFLKDIIHSAETKTHFDQTKFNHEVFTHVEEPFTKQKGVKLIEVPQTQNLLTLVKQIVALAAKTIEPHHKIHAAVYFVDYSQTYN